MQLNRIHIIGAPGSGKTYLARQLSARLGIERHELDDLQWDNAPGEYGKKRDAAERATMLKRITEQEKWIIEGVYHSWLNPAFEAADAIVLLQPGNFVRGLRIIRRHFSSDGRQQNLNQLYDLWHWGQDYAKNTFPLVVQQTEPHRHKRQIHTSADRAYSALCN